MKNVKIVSGGVSVGTHVFNEDGAEIHGITSIDWHARIDDVCRAEIEIGVVQTEVGGRAKFFGPGGREIRRIEYADGTVEEY